MFVPDIGYAQPAEITDELPADITELELGKLLTLELVVTSPGRKEQRLSDVASAVHVISQEDIARSGATHWAELLRSVPGVSVARVSSNKWAISIRGFNQIFAHRLLVLEDGVSVFSPTTNGVYWETQDVPLENIERIEVIRGPGAVLWGENAVNGVINIITKKASETQGSRVQVGGGNKEKAIASMTYGGRIGDGHYRLFGRHIERGSNELDATEESALDNWTSSALGTRMDFSPSKQDAVTFLMDGQLQRENSLPLTPSLEPPFVDGSLFRDTDAEWRSAKSMVNWQRQLSPNSEVEIKASALYKERKAELISFNYQIYTMDAQHHYRFSEWNDLLYGGSIRFFRNESQGTIAQEVNPATRETVLANGFLQDEITLVPERLKLILGSKFEHNDHTGYEFMPNGRLLYTPTTELTVWGAVSRATSTPAVFFEDTRIPVSAFPIEGASLPGVATLIGSRAIKSENLLAYETGLRTQLHSDVYLDVAAFYNDYTDVFSLDEGEPTVQPYGLSGQPALIVPLTFGNALHAYAFGVETALTYQISESFSLAATYSYIDLSVQLNGSKDQNDKDLIEGSTPPHQATLRPHVRLSESLFLDGTVRFVDRLRFGGIGSYIDLDAKLGWKVTESLELSLVGINLLHDSHPEFQGNLFGPPRTSMERAGYLAATVTF